jgi:hypothetical protein
MTSEKITRGISESLAEAFKNCPLNELYLQNKNELLIGVRKNYLNIYYNCDSIAKVELKKGKIICEIDTFYLFGKSCPGPDKRLKVDASEICNNYATIKKNSDIKATAEKKAQSKLVILNNNNPDSKWHCIDVEWVKAFENQSRKNEAGFNGRFDIIAISKSKPHTVAFIELKYGSGAIGGKSGINKHIRDFKKFQDSNYFDKYEICDIMESYRMLQISIPEQLTAIQVKDIIGYRFYVITLNNNVDKENGSTPKQTMAGYLFNDKRWNCKKISTKTAETDFGDVTDKSNSIHVNFLFSKQTLDNLTISDILEDNDYERS